MQKVSSDDRKKKAIVFFHPDLGIGGAERLVVDAAVNLQNLGHKVTIFTSHCDSKHCFDEARDGTLDVRIRGETMIPQSILSRFFIVCAILRQYHLIFQVFFNTELDQLKPDVFFVDQLSAGLPLLRYLFPGTRILFYCHFPDLLLAQGRTKWWKRAYRIPFDWIEEWSMKFADGIAVNSGFTKSIVTRVWPALAREKELKVVYPCVDIGNKDAHDSVDLVLRDNNIILSINRYEAKKDVGLAIRAFAGLKKQRDGVRLVIAGGYDCRIQENYTYHKELEELTKSLSLRGATCKNITTTTDLPKDVDVIFLLSVTNSLKDALLKSARLLIYTPSNEHFGIVPLEAMLVGTPVLAANTGGPLETVVDGVTGWLRSPADADAWTEVVEKILYKTSNIDLEKIAKSGQERVRKEFSGEKMAERITNVIADMEGKPRRTSAELSIALACLLILPSLGILGLTFLLREQLR